MYNIRFLLLSFLLYITPAYSYISRITTFLFGDRVAQEEISYFTQAYTMFNMQDKPLVYYINNNSWLNEFGSFTWKNHWISKDTWKDLAEHTKIFCASHESAHVECNHNRAIIITSISSAIFGTIASYVIAKKITNNTIIQAFATVVASFGINRILIPAYSRSCEVEADCVAARALCDSGQVEVVEKCIQDLKNSLLINDDQSMWFADVSDKIAYLQAVIDEYNVQKRIVSIQ